jgi:hypothetical protein
LGNNTPLYLSSSAVEIVSTLNVTSTITGSNLSGTNTGDETNATIKTKLGAATSSNSGYLTSADWSTFINKIAGSGTINTIPKFSSSSSIADSTITDTGSAVTIGVATSVTGSLTASSIIKSGGTSSQFLKANGSVDSTTYTPTSRTLTINGTSYDLSADRSWTISTISGSGTTNYLPKFTSSSAIGNSLIYNDANSVLINDTFNVATNYKLQVNGDIYTSGSIAIGSVSSISTKLFGIGRAITGATTAYGITFEGNIESTVTTNGIVYRSYPIVTGGTLSAITHYIASKNAFIGGSTVTNQYGFFADASVIDATNNYGFYGNIASATGAWNLYMNGTAQNYINGNLGIGVTVPTVKLDVSGAGLFSSSVTASSFIKSGGTSAQLLAGDGSVVTAGTNITISGGTISSSGGLSGSGTTNYVTKFTGSSSLGNSIIYDSGTAIGIGTTSPAATLDVSGNINSSTNVRALRFWGGPSVFTTHSAPLHIFSSTIGTGAIARFNNNESTDASTLTSMWLENYAGYRAELAYTTHLNGSNIYINNTYNSGNILFSINSSEKARILNTGQFKLNGYTSTSSFTGTAVGYLAFDSSGNILTTAAPSGGISGSGTTNYIPKFTGSTAIGNSLIFDNGTNVGIGAASPSTLLQVGTNFKVTNDAVTTWGPTNSMGLLSWDTNLAIIGGTANTAVQFRANNAEFMRLTTSGNLGIGITNPSQKLEVYNNVNAGGGFKITNINGGGSTSAATYYHNGNVTHEVGVLGTGYGGYGALLANEFYAYAGNTNMSFGADGVSSSIKFGTGSGVPERMRITSAGNVGIGTSSPAVKLDVIGALNVTSDSSEQIVIKTLTDTNRQLLIGYSYSSNQGVIQAVQQGVSYRNIALNPNGGNVGIGTSSPATKLTIQGDLSIFDNSKIILGQNQGGGASLFYNSNGNLDITPRTGYNTIFTAGNVGIGTASPTGKLSIAGQDEALRLQSNGVFISFLNASNTTRTGYIQGNAGSNITIAAEGSNFLQFTSATDIVSITSGNERMRINAGGSVGIGTSSPAGLLDLNSASANDRLVLSYSGSPKCVFGITTAGVSYLYHHTSSSFPMWISAAGNFGIGTTSPTRLLSVNSQAYISADIFQGQNSGIFFSGDGSYATGVYGRNSGLDLVFQSNSAERARIASDGRFQVNNTGYSANCTATLRALSSTGTDRILECITIGYSSAFYVQTNGSYFFAGSNLSDARTKKDINYLEESILDKVMKLKPASFRYKENEENIKGGFIAQDIKEIFPDLVTATKSDDEMMGVDYYGVIAILTKAIQEQQIQIEELKAKLK